MRQRPLQRPLPPTKLAYAAASRAGGPRPLSETPSPVWGLLEPEDFDDVLLHSAERIIHRAKREGHYVEARRTSKPLPPVEELPFVLFPPACDPTPHSSRGQTPAPRVKVKRKAPTNSNLPEEHQFAMSEADSPQSRRGGLNRLKKRTDLARRGAEPVSTRLLRRGDRRLRQGGMWKSPWVHFRGTTVRRSLVEAYLPAESQPTSLQSSGRTMSVIPGFGDQPLEPEPKPKPVNDNDIFVESTRRANQWLMMEGARMWLPTP